MATVMRRPTSSSVRSVSEPSETVPPAELVQRAAAGDERAWEQLVDRFAPVVWGVCRSVTNNSATVADAYQETWARLSSHIDSIQHPERIAGWLATTAKREAIRLSKRAAREVPDGTFVELPVTLDDPSGAASVQHDEHRIVVEAFEQLDERCQLLLRLLIDEPDIGYADISNIMHMPIGSIGPTRARCLKKLRDRLEARGYER